MEATLLLVFCATLKGATSLHFRCQSGSHGPTGDTNCTVCPPHATCVFPNTLEPLCDPDYRYVRYLTVIVDKTICQISANPYPDFLTAYAFCTPRYPATRIAPAWVTRLRLADRSSFIYRLPYTIHIFELNHIILRIICTHTYILLAEHFYLLKKRGSELPNKK